MKKITLSLLLSGLLTQGFAQPFIGVEVGHSKIDDNYINTDDSGISYGFKFGSQNENWRATFGYNYLDSEESILTQHLFYVSADYIFTNETELLRPYAGIMVGFSTIDYDYYNVENTLSYGLEGGLIFNVDPHFDIDIGVKYAWYYMDNTLIQNPYTPIQYYDEPFNNYLNYSISLNYKF